MWLLMNTVFPCCFTSVSTSRISFRHRINAVGGFIEQDQIRIVRKCLRQADALHHAFGIRADGSIRPFGHADDVEELGGAPAARVRGTAARAAKIQASAGR